MDRGQCHILVIKSWSGWNPTVVCKLNICLPAALRGSGGGMAESGGGVGKVPSTHFACALCKEPSVDREASHLCTCSFSRRRWFHEPWMGEGLERMRVTPGKAGRVHVAVSSGTVESVFPSWMSCLWMRIQTFSSLEKIKELGKEGRF